MANMTAFAIGPVPTDVVTMGQPIGDVRSIGAIGTFLVPFSAKMVNPYTVGGDSLVVPSNPPLISGMALQSVIITSPKVGANWYTWNQSASAPKIQAWTAFNTESGAVDLSAVTITGFLVYVT